MSHTFTIMKKELKTYFNSPIAYIVLAVFLIITGWFFASNLFLMKQASMRHIIEQIIPLVMFFFIPAITMRLIAEEKKAGTLELLLTMPIKTKDIILGKFLAALILLCLGIVLTLPYFFTISLLGNPDVGQTIAGYIGLLFLGGTYLSIGIFASSITKNQIIAFIVGFVILLLLFMLDKITILFSGHVANIFQYISADYHFKNIARGVIDSKDIFYFLSMIVFFLFMSNRTLESMKG